MKILHIIEQLYLGGAEKDLINKANYLADYYDINNYIFCFFRKGPLANSLNEKITLIYRNYSHKLYAVIKEAFLLEKIINNIKPDIIHSHLFSAELIIALYKIITRNNIPCISSVQSLVQHIKRTSKPIKKISDIFARKYYNKIIACSNAVKNELLANKYRADKIEVIYNAVYIEEYSRLHIKSTNSLPNTPIIGFIGRLEPYKGVETLIKSIPFLKNKFDSFQVWIIGDGHQKQYLEQLSIKLNLTDKILFYGAQLSIESFLKKFSLLVVPSLSEALGIIALEGLAAKLPVIASNIDGLVEIIKDNITGFLVPPNDPKALADKITFVIENYQFAQQIANQGYLFCKQNFDIKILAEKLYLLYKSLVS